MLLIFFPNALELIFGVSVVDYDTLPILHVVFELTYVFTFFGIECSLSMFLIVQEGAAVLLSVQFEMTFAMLLAKTILT
jgi:hypothetical protein